MEKYKANIFGRTKDGSTLVHVASAFGHPDTALIFLKKGILVHMPNKVGGRVGWLGGDWLSVGWLSVGWLSVG